MPIRINTNENYPKTPSLTWWESKGHNAHWLRPGQAQSTFAEMRIMTHLDRPWLTIDTSEQATLPSDKISSKRTMVTLSEEDGRSLYNWLKTVYEPNPIQEDAS